MNDQVMQEIMSNEGEEEDPTVARARRLLIAIQDKRDILSGKLQSSVACQSELAASSQCSSRRSSELHDQIRRTLLQSLDDRRTRVQRMIEEKKEDNATRRTVENCESASDSLCEEESICSTIDQTVREHSWPMEARVECTSSAGSSNEEHSLAIKENKQSYERYNISFGTEATVTTAELSAESGGGAIPEQEIPDRDVSDDKYKTVPCSGQQNGYDDSSVDDSPDTFDVDCFSQNSENGIDSSENQSVSQLNITHHQEVTRDSPFSQQNNHSNPVRSPELFGRVATVTNSTRCEPYDAEDEENEGQVALEKEKCVTGAFASGTHYVITGDRRRCRSFDNGTLSSQTAESKRVGNTCHSLSFDNYCQGSNVKASDETVSKMSPTDGTVEVECIDLRRSIQYTMDDEYISTMHYHKIHKRWASDSLCCSQAEIRNHDLIARSVDTKDDLEKAADIFAPPVDGSEGAGLGAAEKSLGHAMELEHRRRSKMKSSILITHETMPSIASDSSVEGSVSEHSDVSRADYLKDMYSSEELSQSTGAKPAHSGCDQSAKDKSIFCRKGRVMVYDSDGEDMSLSLIISDGSSMDFTTDSNTSGWISEIELGETSLYFPREVRPEYDEEISEFSGGVADSLLGDLDALEDEPSLLGSCVGFELSESQRERTSCVSNTPSTDKASSAGGRRPRDHQSLGIDLYDSTTEKRWVLVSKVRKRRAGKQRVKWNLPKSAETKKKAAGCDQALILSEEEADEQCKGNRGLYAIALSSGLRFDGFFNCKKSSEQPNPPQQFLRLSTDFRCGAQGSLYDIALRSGFDLAQPWNWKKQRKYIPARGGLWHISGLDKKALRSRKPFTVKTYPGNLEEDDEATVLPEEITDYECGAMGNLFLAFETAGGDYIAKGSLYYLASKSGMKTHED